MATFVDLFCGIGGFHIAMARQGMECVFACDIDPKARDVYSANFGITPAGDITQIESSRIPPHDVLCAGFPCQSFSVCGKRGGLDDPRGSLWYEVIRIAKYHKPKIILLENVPNLLKIAGGRIFHDMETDLKHSIAPEGYSVYYKVLNSLDYGLTQCRKRLYVVCIRNDAKLGEKEKLSVNWDKLGGRSNRNQKSVFDIRCPDGTEKDLTSKMSAEDLKQVKRKFDEVRMWDGYLTKPDRLGGIGGSTSQGMRIYSMAESAVTLLSQGGGWGAKTGLYYDVSGKKPVVRTLSHTECKRLMTFPDTHIISEGASGYKQLGNAVMPAMVMKVYGAIG